MVDDDKLIFKVTKKWKYLCCYYIKNKNGVHSG